MRGKITKIRGKITKVRGRYLLLVIVMLITSLIKPVNATAATSYITRRNFIKLLVQAMDLEIEKTSSEPYIEAAVRVGIIKENSFKDYNKRIARQDAAVILNRADEYLHDDDLDDELYNFVLKERISDINKVTKSKREAVAKVYAKGIITGYTNGYFIKSRQFRGSGLISSSDAKVAIKRTVNPSLRTKLSPDGQLIRTTNLPKNADKYEYILDTYPNYFYEKKFIYQRTKYYYKPQIIKDYAPPKRVYETMRKDTRFENGKMIYLYDWANKVEQNVLNRLNVDYRTIDKNNTWLNNLRKTYYVYDNAESNKRMTDDIKEYVKFVKKNKIVIESKVVTVEPSTLYYSKGYSMRVYAKFKITSSNFDKIKDDTIYGGYISGPKPLQEGKWMECVFNIGLGSKNGNSHGDDYAVDFDTIVVFAD